MATLLTGHYFDWLDLDIICMRRSSMDPAAIVQVWHGSSVIQRSNAGFRWHSGSEIEQTLGSNTRHDHAVLAVSAYVACILFYHRNNAISREFETHHRHALPDICNHVAGESSSAATQTSCYSA